MSSGKKVPWDEILRRKAEFIRGQILCAEPLPGNGGVLIRAEIANILMSGDEIIIDTAWAAQRLEKSWHKLNRRIQVSGNATEPILYDDGGYEFTLRFISGCMTLYPKGHGNNIHLEQVIDEAA